MLKVELYGGNMSIWDTEDEEKIIRHIGQDNIQSIDNASKDDISWFKAMGGSIQK